MDKYTVVRYGFLIVTALILTAILLLATPFGVYIGDAVSTFVQGGQNKSEHDANKGFADLTDEFNNMMNEDRYSHYVESGLYDTESEYYQEGVYDTSFENAKYSWTMLVNQDVIFVENATLKANPDIFEDKNGNLYEDRTQMNAVLRGDLVINASAMAIGDECFKDCEYLTAIYIKDTLSIGNKSFENCTQLKTLYIASPSLQVIGEKAFFGSGLKDIFFNGTKEEFEKIKWATTDKDGNETYSGIYVTIHCKDQTFEASI